MSDTFRSKRGLERLVNFSDAVVAIAITLLVLPLTDVVGEAQHESAFTIMTEHRSQFAGFLLTFAVTATHWTRHHSLFELVNAYDHGLLRLNMFWLLLVVLLPFASGLVGEYGFGDGNGVIYSGTMAVLSLLLGAMGTYLGRHRDLLRPDVLSADLNVTRAWIYAAFFAAIAVVSVFAPGPASWLLLLLFPLSWLARPRERSLASTTR